MDLKEFIRQNEKMNSSLITDWSKEMLLEAIQTWTDNQLLIQRVVQQRELFIDLLKWVDDGFKMGETAEIIVDDYIKEKGNL
jgi:hypothetical protein